VGFEPTTPRLRALCSIQAELRALVMNSRGFEPPTPGLKAQCSIQAELRVHKFVLLYKYIIYNKYIKRSDYIIIFMTQNIYKINILKLDHRPERDKRITSHCALVSRAFGAKNIYYSGIEDINFEKNIKDVCKRWGGNFKTNYLKKPLSFVKKEKENGCLIVHLTMYGEKLEKKIKNIKKNKNILIIVGGPKVPREYYNISDYNISIGSQPHSEVAALALCIYFLDNDCLNKKFKSNLKIIPNKNKKIIKKKED
jgi:tRNA (cytidine56-2'-O)-methyltransferase